MDAGPGRSVVSVPPAAASPPSLGRRRALFTDRDGTLNPDFHYLSDPDRYDFLPGVRAGLSLLHEHGYLVVCVTNQSGVGRGLFTEARLAEIHERIQQRLGETGERIDAFYHCPHRPEEGCACRKPGRALFDRAARDLGIDLRLSAIIGDRSLDIEVGRTLGMRTLLVPERGLERAVEEELRARGVRPDLYAGSFFGAALQLLSLG